MSIHCDSRNFAALLGSTELRIPVYQRMYAWKTKNVRGLWDDILGAARLPADRRALFLGAVVIHSTKVDGAIRRYVVDGQQRITTLSVMISVGLHQLRALKSAKGISPATQQRAGELIHKCRDLLLIDDELLGHPGDVDPGSLESGKLRFVPGKRDRDQFEAIIRTNRPKNKGMLMGKAWTEVHKLLEDAVRERVELFVSSQEDLGDEEIANARATALCDVVQALARAIGSFATFAEIEVSAPYNPLMVFESMNYKNMRLAESDLIKNLIVQNAGSAQREEQFANEWDEVAKAVNDETVRFLRHWFIAHKEHITVSQLYDKVQENISNAADARAHLDMWAQAAPWYEAIRGRAEAPSSNSAVRRAVADLAAMGFAQGTSVVLAFALHGGEKQLPSVTELLATLYIRVLRTAQVRGSVVEQHLEEICREARANPADGLSYLRQTVRQLVLRHTRGLDWRDFVIRGEGLQKYILRAIANQMESDTLAIEAPDKVQIEHIWPRRPSKIPSGMTRDQYEGIVDHVGNLTLLLAGDNQSAGNQDVAIKGKLYAEYGDTAGPKRLRITGDLGEITTWSRQEIVERAERLAEVAEEVWPVPDDE